MSEQAFEPDTNNDLLSKIRVGMSVYDHLGKHIGTVRDLYMGASSPEAEARGSGSATAALRDPAGDVLFNEIMKAFAPNELPKIIQQRMIRQGFIAIEGSGLFASPRYALTEHIEGVSGDHVRLRVSRDDLIKRD